MEASGSMATVVGLIRPAVADEEEVVAGPLDRNAELLHQPRRHVDVRAADPDVGLQLQGRVAQRRRHQETPT